VPERPRFPLTGWSAAGLMRTLVGELTNGCDNIIDGQSLELHQ